MAKTQLTKNTTTGNWELTETDQGQTYTNTLQTDGLSVEGDIKLSITAKSGNAPVATSLSGTGASASLSGTTITLSKVVTNAGSTFTAGWINSKPTGNATLTLSGTVPTESKNCTPSASTQTITPSSGKLLSSVVVEAVPGIETETKTVKSTLATATVTPTAGKYINQVIVSPVVVEEQTVSPSTSTQTITPTSGNDYLSKVVVNAIQVETKSVKSTTATQTITPTSGKYISKVTVNPVIVQSKTATPSTATQTISPSSGYDYLTSVKVDPIPSEYIIPTGTITITQQTGTNVTQYASADVRSASNFSLVATDNTGVVSVGTLASGYYPLTNSITASLSAGTPGWFTSGSANDSSVQVGKMAAAVPSAAVSSLSSPTVALSGVVSGMATATTGSYYVTISGSGTNGSVKAKYTNSTAGYAPKNTSGTESAASAIAPNITGGKTIYIKACTITNNTSGGTSSGTINRGSQIKIGQGYNPSDVYYTAQNNSGTMTVSSAGTSSCNGYASVNVPSGSAVASAEKGTVSGNKVSVTPKVTKSAGWISTETVSGTAVEVSASELVSGTLTPTSSGTKDVTNYASVNITAGTAGIPTATKGTVSGNKVTITPKVTNSAGWISSGTISGTAVTVTASELVSGTYTVSGSGTANVTNYASISVASGSASQPDTTFNASSVSLEDDVVTLQANVTPSVSPGWVASGTSGTITIQGTITVPTFKKVTVTASSSQIYVVKGSVTIKAKNSAEGTGTTISDTYFKITSIATSSYQGGSYQTTVTYQTMKVYTSGSAPDWDSATTVAYGSLSSGGTCVLQFECGQGVVAKCSSTATSIAYYSDGSVTSGQYVYTMPYQIDAKRELCWYYLYVKCSSATNTRCLFYPYLGISYIQNYKPTASSARSTMTIRYRYSSNGSSYTSDSCSATASSSGQYTGSFDLYARYYPISEYL